MSAEVGLEPSDTRAGGKTTRAAGVARHSLARAGILVPFLILFTVLSLTSEPFATKANLLNILEQQSSTLIIAAAFTLVLVSGGIDLSVGAVWGLAAVVSAHFALETDPALAMLLGIGAGLLVGLANGIVTTVFRINALIATLAMAFIVNGVSGLVSGGNLLVLFAKPDFGNLARPELFTVKTMIWVMIVAVVVLGLLLATSTAGRYMYAAGGNADAARLAGVRVDGIRILAFALTGTAAGLAGVLDTSNGLTASLQTTANDNLTFTVIAGVVIGGTSILGGEGAVWRSVVGVLFIALIDNGYALLQYDQLWEPITLGLLLLAAVALDAVQRGLVRPGAAVRKLAARAQAGRGHSRA
jgi:ribose transport system permease protein